MNSTQNKSPRITWMFSLNYKLLIMIYWSLLICATYLVLIQLKFQGLFYCLVILTSQGDGCHLCGSNLCVYIVFDDHCFILIDYTCINMENLDPSKKMLTFLQKVHPRHCAANSFTKQAHCVLPTGFEWRYFLLVNRTFRFRT